MTQRERYYNDPAFHTLVSYMVNFIMKNQYSPSEMRDAAVMASIIYEEQTVRSPLCARLKDKGDRDKFLSSDVSPIGAFGEKGEW